MPLAVPPAFLMAVLLILLGTQVAYVVAPRRPPYLGRLALSVVAVAVSETAGWFGVGAQVAVGDLHPLPDLLLLALLQWGATAWLARRPVV